MAKVLVMFVAVNLSVSTSSIIPNEAKYLKRRPENGINTRAYPDRLRSMTADQVV